MAEQNKIPIEFSFEKGNFKDIKKDLDDLYVKAKAIQSALSNKKSEQQIKKSELAMRKLALQAEKVTLQEQKHALAQKKFNAQLDKTNKRLATGAKATNTWSKALGSFQFKFNALGNIAANVGSAIQRNITRSLREAVKTVIEFEKTFAEVLTLLNKTQKDQFKEVLKQNSVDLMRKYGLTIQDTNKAMFDAISAGVKVADVYKVLDAAARLAVGGVTDLNSATKGIASVLNAFSLEMTEAENVATAFFQAQKFGITYIDDMVKSMGRANTIASLTGASYRDMLAAFTAITKSGLNTEEAVTGLRNIFKELVAPSKEAENMLKELGIAVGATAVRKRKFVGVLDDLQKAFLKNNEVIPQVFGNIRGLTGIMGILGDRYEDFRFVLMQVNDAMASQESLNDAVAEQMGTLSKKLDVLSSNWSALWVAVGEGSSDSNSLIKRLIDAINELLVALAPDFYEKYTAGMAAAQEQSEELQKTIKKEASDRSALYKDSAKADEVYTETIIRKGKLRVDALKEESDEAQGIYEENAKDLIEKNKELDKLRDERLEALKVGQFDEALAKDVLIDKLVKEIAKQEEITDETKLTYIEKKALYESMFNWISEEIKLKIDAAEEDEERRKKEKKAHDEWVKRQAEIIRRRKGITKAVYDLAEESFEVEKGWLDAERDYNKQVINLIVEDTKEKYDKLYKEDLEYFKKLKELYGKYYTITRLTPKDLGGNELDTSLPDSERGDITLPDLDEDPTLTDYVSWVGDSLDAISEFTDAFVALADARIDAINREIDASNERVRSLEADRQLEWERMQAGYANNYDLKEKELEDERKRREELRLAEEEALQQRKKAADAQVAIDTLLQLSNLVTAATSMIAANASIPVVGVVIGLAAAAAMLAGFLSIKANAASAVSGFAEGVIDLQGDGTETSDSIPARLSKRESIMTAKTTKHNKNTLTEMQGNPQHPLFKVLNEEGVNSVWNKLNETISDQWINVKTEPPKDDKLLKEMKEHHRWQRSKPYSYERGGYRWTVQGNVVTKYRINDR